MLVKYTVVKVDIEGGFVLVTVEYEGGIVADYSIEVESFVTSDNDPEHMLKAALDSVVRQLAAKAFPPPPLGPPSLQLLEGWQNEFTQP